jgi:spermidine/putrescine transport system permease protein
MNKSRGFERCSILLVAAWLLLFAAVPNCLILIVSFFSRSDTAVVAFDFTWNNYTRFADPLFFSVFWQSFRLAAGCTILCLLFGYPLAYVIARSRSRAKNLMLLLVIIPFWTSSLIRTYALVIILKANGLLNGLLQALGWIDRPLQLMYTDGAVLLGLSYALLPFMVLPLYAAIEKLDSSVLEAARDLGANRLRAFCSVTLPLTAPGIMAGVMLTFLPAMGMFYIPDILGGAKSLLIGNFIKNQFLISRDWPLGSAASVGLNVIMASMLWLYYRTTRGFKTETLL